jgi:hypothetical protein
VPVGGLDVVVDADVVEVVVVGVVVDVVVVVMMVDVDSVVVGSLVVLVSVVVVSVVVGGVSANAAATPTAKRSEAPTPATMCLTDIERTIFANPGATRPANGYSAAGYRADRTGLPRCGRIADTAVAMDVFGREEELARAESFLDFASKQPRVLLFEGEPGIGKTTLWRATVARALEHGVRVLDTRPAEAEQELSYAGLGDLLDGTHDEIGHLPGPQRRALRITS